MPPRNSKLTQVHVYVTPDTREALRLVAERRGALPAAMLRMALVEWLQEQIPEWRPGRPEVLERWQQEAGWSKTAG